MGVKNNLKLIFSYFKLNLKKEWKYKSSFFMQIIMMILNDLFFIIQWYVIFQLVDNIGGYGFNETMLLWALAAGGYGFSHTFFAGAWNLKDIVYEGKLDVFLTQPKSVIINVCCSSTDVSGIGDMIYAFVLTDIVSFEEGNVVIGIINYIMMLLLIITTLVTLYTGISYLIRNKKVFLTKDKANEQVSQKDEISSQKEEISSQENEINSQEELQTSKIKEEKLKHKKTKKE